MNSQLIKLFVTTTIIIIAIVFVKYHKQIISYIKKKFEKFNKTLILTILFLFLGGIIGILIKQNYDSVVETVAQIAVNEKMRGFYETIKEENKYYKEIIDKEYESSKSYQPYIPKDFKFVTGTVDTGFVIEDTAGNQYVWVPCSNIEDEKNIKLQRCDFIKNPNFSKQWCYNTEYKEFLQNTLDNGGFYISRYEIGKEEDKPVSKEGKEVWLDITRNEAKSIVSKMYQDNEEIKCEIINGYAYDTTLLWIQKSNEIEKYKEDFKEDKTKKSGRHSYNNIFDFTDNLLEVTLENYRDTAVIIRGFSEGDYVLTANENKLSDESRYVLIDNNSKINFLNDELGIRTIIFKK